MATSKRPTRPLVIIKVGGGIPIVQLIVLAADDA
jgi:hypothetical protein